MQPHPHDDVDQVRETILNAASENSELLHQLAKTEEAPGLYDAQQRVVEATKKELIEQKSTLRRLQNATEEQYVVHKKLRDSRFRRIYYRVTRMLEKFDAQAMKEEREYFNSLAAQSKAEGREKGLQEDLEQAEAALVPLGKLAKAHGDIHFKIDALYESLFAGRTPGFPFEDEREQAFYAAREGNEYTKRDIIGARQALKLLNQASIYLTRALNYTAFALQDASASFFFFDEAYGLLHHSVVNIGHARKAFEKASVALGTVTTEMQAVDTLFLHVFQAADLRPGATNDRSDLVPRIESVRDRVAELHEEIEVVSKRIKEREVGKVQELKTTARVMEEARQGLEEVRQGIFEEVAGFGEAAPAYNYCCDRTDWHCEIPPPENEDADIFNLPAGPTPAEVAAQAAEQSKQQDSQPIVAQGEPLTTRLAVQDSTKSGDQLAFDSELPEVIKKTG